MSHIVKKFPDLEELSVWSIDCKGAEAVDFEMDPRDIDQVEAHRQKAFAMMNKHGILPKISMFQDMEVVRSRGKAMLMRVRTDESEDSQLDDDSGDDYDSELDEAQEAHYQEGVQRIQAFFARERERYV